MQSNPRELAGLSLLDCSGAAPRQPAIWPPLLVPKEAIDAEIARLQAIPRPANGRRAAAIVHPHSLTANSFTPGTAVLVQVLLPGESTVPMRTNANQLEISIAGGGTLHAGRTIASTLHDVWTVPPMVAHRHENTGSEPWVRLTYSNAPLLQLLGVLMEHEGSELEPAAADDGVSERQRSTYTWSNAPDLQVNPEGARLRGYEYLTDIPVVPNPPLHWPWASVRPQLSDHPGDGKRNIWLLYHPATGRRNGTTGSYFATIGGCPPGTPPFTGQHGHRHTSASINYHIQGHGSSVVDGVRVQWKAGDLLLSAPSWSEHAHYHGEEGWKVLTVQDHPLHIAMGSLLWQEKFDGPILALGAEEGQKGYVSPRTQGD